MSIEILNSLERKTTFTINKSEVDLATKTELKKYIKDAKVQGFRPGKAPLHIVEQMYGGKAYEEALNRLINQQFTDLVIKEKINLAAYPKFDLTSSEGDSFVFSAKFEIMPEVKIGDLANHTVQKFNCSITDPDIDKAIDKIRNQHANYLETDEPAKVNDKVIVDLCGKLNGVPFDGGKLDNHTVIIGQNTLLPDLENGLIGLKSGESKTIAVKFPENYHNNDLKGKDTQFEVTVKQVTKPELPALDSELVKKMGIPDGSIDSLRKEVKTNLTRLSESTLHNKFRESALDALSKSSPLDVPYSLVHDEIHNLMDRREEEMKRYGYTSEQIKLTHEMFENEARRIVTLRMLIQKFIQDHKLTVNDEDIKNVIKNMSNFYEDQDQYIKWYYEDKARVDNARAIAMENKVIEKISSIAKTENADISYDKLVSA